MNIMEPALRQDSLTLRLSVNISRLPTGDALSIRALLDEIGVSECMHRRDVRPRLLCLDMISSRLF